MDLININQRNISIDKKDVLSILSFQENDIIFLSGSLIEGSMNSLSKGMGNKLSDIDVFILSEDIGKIEKSMVDYDQEYKKTQFKKLYKINLDIEIYSKQVISDIMNQLNNYDFTNNSQRTLNILNLPQGLSFSDITSFIHRFLNGVPIYNEESFNDMKQNFTAEKYYRLMTRIAINEVDVYYDDVIGNLESGELEVAVNIARTVLLSAVKAYIFHKKTSLDRNKWIPLKIKNLAQYDKEAGEIYSGFKKLYYEEKLDDERALRLNAENIINFSNDIIDKIGFEGGI